MLSNGNMLDCFDDANSVLSVDLKSTLTMNTPSCLLISDSGNVRVSSKKYLWPGASMLSLLAFSPAV